MAGKPSRARDSDSGQFTTKGYAATHPKTTEIEQIKQKTK